MRFHLFPPKYCFTPIFERFIREKVKPGGRILDLASRDFRMARYFQDLAYVGADIDQEALLVGKDKHPVPYCMGVCCNILSTPFAEEAFDYVISTHTLIHVPGNNDKLKALSELIRVTRKGGHLFFNVPLDEGLEDQVDALLSRYMARVNKVRYRRALCGVYETTMSRYAHRSNSRLIRYVGHFGSLLAHAFDRYGPYSYAIYVCELSGESAHLSSTENGYDAA